MPRTNLRSPSLTAFRHAPPGACPGCAVRSCKLRIRFRSISPKGADARRAPSFCTSSILGSDRRMSSSAADHGSGSSNRHTLDVLPSEFESHCSPQDDMPSPRESIAGHSRRREREEVEFRPAPLRLPDTALVVDRLPGTELAFSCCRIPQFYVPWCRMPFFGQRKCGTWHQGRLESGIRRQKKATAASGIRFVYIDVPFCEVLP